MKLREVNSHYYYELHLKKKSHQSMHIGKFDTMQDDIDVP